MKSLRHCVMYVSDSSGDTECAGITLTPELVNLCLSRIAEFERMKAQDHRFYQLRFWDTGPQFLKTSKMFDGMTDFETGDTVCEHVRDGDYARVNDLPDIPDQQRVRVEGVRMIVSNAGIGWEAWIKHTDHMVETVCLGKYVFEDMKGGSGDNANQSNQ